MERKTHFSKSWLALILLFSILSVRSGAEGVPTKQQTAPVLKEIQVPVIHVKGSHYEVGYQIGTQLKKNLLQEVAEMKADPDWKKVRAEAELFLAYSRKYLPEYVAEVQGAADAAGLELEDLFPSLCEELGDENYRFTKGCSDLIASNDVTADGSVLAGHNNDTSPSTQELVTIIHYQVDGEPEIVAVGYGGLGISVGYNSAGISLTGNQVDSNDMRIGVPRLLLVRKILAARTIGQAIDTAILKERASNYNQVITDHNGEIYSIEGSATDYAPLYSTEGYLVHTNHYLAPWMRKFEFDPHGITSSIVRYNRGVRLLKNNRGRISVDLLKQFLSDHVNHPGSICRHGAYVKTTFSVIINLTTGTMLLARGNPCEVKYNEYKLFTRKES
ncbi:MAG TPA: C45 family peptidase [Candidatus Desulfaltia sp.]|nr:C45 family peptidase [Candidatus Desulfaltia sp.]